MTDQPSRRHDDRVLKADVVALEKSVNGLVGVVRDLNGLIHRSMETANVAKAVAEEARDSTVPREELRLESVRTTHSRRQAVSGVLLVVILTIFGHDQHIEHCGVGARTEAVVNALVQGEPPTIAVVRAQDAASKWCDVTFPLHDHDDNGYPHKYNIIGFGLYGALAAALVAWAHTPREARKANRVMRRKVKR